MPKKLTQEEFISRARKTHGDKYDYSITKYLGNRKKICIICPKHGEFWQMPRDHFRGCECPKCSINSALSLTEFINKSKTRHGNKYDYSKVMYINGETKVSIVCPIHGEFAQRAKDHLCGRGCPKCANNIKSNIDEFILKAKKVHGCKYQYDKVEYTTNKGKVIITCPTHGDFLQSPQTHLRGSGCPYCGHDVTRTKVAGIGITDENCKRNKDAYEHWCQMLKRCYTSSYIPRLKSYIGCAVCEEWLTFSKFKEWFDKEYIDGYDLDKDILIKGNKIYSPATCCFAPRKLNNLIRKHGRPRSLPLGVIFLPKKDKYQAKIRINGKDIYLGIYSNPEEAHLAYKKAKEQYVKELATEYYNKGKIAQKVYEALMRYEVEP